MVADVCGVGVAVVRPFLSALRLPVRGQIQKSVRSSSIWRFLNNTRKYSNSCMHACMCVCVGGDVGGRLEGFF